MKIALGCDHRGGKIAFLLTKNLLLPDHYVAATFEESTANEQMLGAFLIEGVSVPNQRAEEAPKLERIRYSLAPKTSENLDSASPVCVDYPDVAAAVAEAVSEGRADKGILVCGTGIGMCITANKFRGIRAAVCYNEVAAELSRRHNDANVLCLSGEFLSWPAIDSIVRRWLVTPFDGGRHAARVNKISECETQTGL